MSVIGQQQFHMCQQWGSSALLMSTCLDLAVFWFFETVASRTGSNRNLNVFFGLGLDSDVWVYLSRQCSNWNGFLGFGLDLSGSVRFSRKSNHLEDFHGFGLDFVTLLLFQSKFRNWSIFFVFGLFYLIL